MLLFSLGILLLVFGATLILNYQIFGILEEEMLRFAFQMTGSYSYTFLAVCGTLMIILALWIMTHAVRRLVKRFFELMAPGQTEVSKSILSALVGMAIEDGYLEGVDQPVLPFFRSYIADDDPRRARITIGHLLSMQSGLERTSGSMYGAWVASPNWVRRTDGRCRRCRRSP